jgi:hypothetical protein
MDSSFHWGELEPQIIRALRGELGIASFEIKGRQQCRPFFMPY